MAENKTKPTTVKPKDFIAAIDNDARRKDAEALVKLFKKATGWQPKMWVFRPTESGSDWPPKSQLNGVR